MSSYIKILFRKNKKINFYNNKIVKIYMVKDKISITLNN